MIDETNKWKAFEKHDEFVKDMNELNRDLIQIAKKVSWLQENCRHSKLKVYPFIPEINLSPSAPPIPMFNDTVYCEICNERVEWSERKKRLVSFYQR